MGLRFIIWEDWYSFCSLYFLCWLVEARGFMIKGLYEGFRTGKTENGTV